MVLVDTSIWVDHLRSGSTHLAVLLDAGQVAGHSFVIGEIACGNLQHRREILRLLQALPGAPRAEDGEVMHMIEEHKLMGRGIGWVDAHLLAAARLGGLRIWIADGRLSMVATALVLAYTML